MAALALAWSFPLATVAGTHLAGAGFSDNANFLWNFWWMREALGSGERFFSTPYLFAPFGTDLTLHTHTALNAFAGATLLERLPPLTAMNVTILVSLFLNAFCAYLLAHRVTGDAAASAVAGLIFGGSPYLAAHLNGHFNLTTAWTLPLFALAVGSAFGLHTRVERRATLSGSPMTAAVAAGVILGATAYIDYYYVVFLIAFALFAYLLAARDWSLIVRGATAASLRLARVFFALAIVDLIVIAGILATGGFDATIAGVRILARDVFNPLQALWILLAVAANGTVAAGPRAAPRRRVGRIARDDGARARGNRRRLRRTADSDQRRRRHLSRRVRLAALLLAERAEGRRRRHAHPRQPVSRALGRGGPCIVPSGSGSTRSRAARGWELRRPSSRPGSSAAIGAIGSSATGRPSAPSSSSGRSVPTCGCSAARPA